MEAISRGEKAIIYPGERYTPRERVWKILEHQEADRVPAELGGCLSFMMKQSYFNLKHYLHLPIFFKEIDYWPGGTHYTSWWTTPIDEKIYRRFRIDFRPISIRFPRPFIPQKLFPDNSYIDECGFHRKAGELYLEFTSPAPLEHMDTVDEILGDPYWPDPEKDRSVEGLDRKAKRLDEAGYAACCVAPMGGPFEASWQRRGFNKFIEDIYFRPHIANALLDKVTDLLIQMYGMMLDQIGDYCTLVGVADDMGAQTSGLLSLKTYRDFIKPRHKKIYDFIHKRTAGKIYLHSCGNVEMYINDYIEEGVNVLNPVQPECPDMGLEGLKEKYGDKLTFCGGVSSQRVLPRGTPADVQAEVMRVLKAGAAGGGMIVAPGHIIQPEVPPWNVCALYDSVVKYGSYPIKL